MKEQSFIYKYIYIWAKLKRIKLLGPKPTRGGNEKP